MEKRLINIQPQSFGTKQNKTVKKKFRDALHPRSYTWVPIHKQEVCFSTYYLSFYPTKLFVIRKQRNVIKFSKTIEVPSTHLLIYENMSYIGMLYIVLDVFRCRLTHAQYTWFTDKLHSLPHLSRRTASSKFCTFPDILSSSSRTIHCTTLCTLFTFSSNCVLSNEKILPLIEYSKMVLSGSNLESSRAR